VTVDIFGGNCVGKSTRIRELREDGRHRRFLMFQTEFLARKSGSAATVVTDEGVIKKIYEAVPFLDEESRERERRRWLRFNAAIGARLFTTLRGIVDLFVYVSVDPAMYLSRVRERQFLTDRVSHDRILRRYELQCEIYDDLLNRVRAIGCRILVIQSGDDQALSRLVSAVRASRR
jgi:pimeloyl-ACP methyl ester carboxylesterase